MSLPQSVQRDSEFIFPKDGTYIYEAHNGQSTLLLDEDEIPVGSEERPLRNLDNFFIFGPLSKTCFPPSFLWESDGPYEAFGWAVPQFEDDELDDRNCETNELEGINLRTSTIWRYVPDINHDNIYIETQYAFYILRNPAQTYRKLFLPFYMREMLLRLVLRSIRDDPNISKDRLVRRISTIKDPTLGRCWAETDFTTENQYNSMEELIGVIHNYEGLDCNEFRKAPVLKLLLRSQARHTPSTERTSIHSSRSGLTALNITKLQPSHERKGETKLLTTVTPLVNAFAANYFERRFTVVGKCPRFLNDDVLDRGRPRTRISEDGIKYKKGDFILLKEHDKDDERKPRFAQILYISDHRKRKKAYHVRWFVHGSKTLLEELAFGQELFLSVADGCGDVLEDYIVCKCKVVRLPLEEFACQKWPPKDTFFYVSSWDRMNPVDFRELTDHQVELGHRICHDCDRLHKPISSIRGSHPNAIAIIRSVHYHMNDFIRYEADAPDQLVCSIGQITGIFPSKNAEVKLEICKLGRERYREGNSDRFKELSLFVTSDTESISTSVVIGKVQVVHINEYEAKSRAWMDNHPDCFYVSSKADSLSAPLEPLPSKAFKKCNVCSNELAASEEADADCRQDNVLKAFDPYIGVGGFGLGLARGCSMSTMAGIELDPDAALTAKINFPANTKIINDDACKILKDLVKGPRQSLIPEGIDFIYSGPPCQNDSALNRHKADPRCPAFTVLSFVEVIRPAFFVMESVPGFLQWKLLGDTPEEIKAGDLKLIVKILRFLGYNVVGRLMDARSYGVPQTRDRFLLVATLPKYGSFNFPEPTHAFDRRLQLKGTSHMICNGLTLKIAVAPGRALHEVVTVEEALSDLPPFDWKSPRKPTRDEELKAELRAMVVPVVSTSDDALWGIEDGDFQYVTPSTNYFQHLARRDMAFVSEKRYQHFTAHFPPYQVENIIDIPFYKSADYRYLRSQAREWSLRDPVSARAMGGYQSGEACGYTRLNPNGYFQTITTQVGPNAKQSTVLHPFCKRIITVRELARSQGFPDDFSFYAEGDYIKAVSHVSLNIETDH
ncbi:S-adenosyl-L-methionine-dependent methyltransferase [Hysterangium stoloniferum]|nr:S-adenosyl-L-methionine-dependent methyltransferase [Hysterangium stoloniferum]